MTAKSSNPFSAGNDGNKMRNGDKKNCLSGYNALIILSIKN